MSEYGRELTYYDLLNMHGKPVLVVDRVPMTDGEDRPHQYCIVYVNIYGHIEIENRAYVFEFDRFGNYVDGEFGVYEIIA